MTRQLSDERVTCSDGFYFGWTGVDSGDHIGCGFGLGPDSCRMKGKPAVIDLMLARQVSIEVIILNVDVGFDSTAVE